MLHVLKFFKKKSSQLSILGLSLEEQIMKIVLVSKEKGTIYLKTCQSIPLTKDAISSALTSISNEKVLRIVTGLEPHEVVFRSLFLPLKARQKVLHALPFQLENILPFPVDQAICCPFFKPANQNTTIASIIATSKDLLKKHLSVFTAWDIHPDIVTCVPLSLFRLARWLYPEKKDLLLFHFGDSRTSCILIQDGEMILSQSIRLGKNELVEALKTAFPEKEEKHFDTFLYRNNLKNREFDKEASQNLDPERMTIAEGQGRVEDPNFEIKPTRSKTDSSSCFGIISGSFEESPSLTNFKKHLSNEVERLAIFIKEKAHISESTPWILLGEYSSCLALNDVWKQVFGDFQLPVEPSPSISTHSLALGFALDALAADGRRIQFLQKEFTPTHHLLARKKKGIIYAVSCLIVSIIIDLTSTRILQNKTKALSEKLQYYFYSPQEKSHFLSQSDIEQELWKCEKSLLKQKDSFSFFLNIPKVSEVLAWVSSHPSFATAEGLPKEGIDIKNFRYQLIKYPTLDAPSIAYQAQIEMEFTAATPRLAREFHDALLKGDRIVNAKKELKWNTQGNVYTVQFELNKSPSL